MSQTLGQGDVIEPFQKFKSAGKLAKTVAHWKIRGGQVAVSISSTENVITITTSGRHSW